MTKALLIIDIQNDYFPGGTMELHNAENAGKMAARLLNYFRQKKLPIIHIQHVATRPGATFFLPNTKGAEIHQFVLPSPQELIIQKHTPNSFHQTNLHQELQRIGVDHLVICGMMTHMCVDSTTRAAKDLGYQCEVVSDACATKDLIIDNIPITADMVQYSFLAALSYYFASITETRNIVLET